MCLDFTGLDTSLERDDRWQKLAVFASASTVILPVVPSAAFLWSRKRRAGELLETRGPPLPPARLAVTHLSLVLPWERPAQNLTNASSKILISLLNYVPFLLDTDQVWIKMTKPNLCKTFSVPLSFRVREAMCMW